MRFLVRAFLTLGVALAAPVIGAGTAEPRVHVSQLRLTGNTILSDADVAQLLAPYVGRQLTAEELHRAARAVTTAYIQRGYVNSGVLIPDQDVASGSITLQAIEGRLSEIDIDGTDDQTERYIRKRIRSQLGDGPLNMDELRESLRLLQDDRRVARLNASLEPAGERGQGRLRVAVEEESPIDLWLEASNSRSPTVGAEELRVRADHWNLAGFGDHLQTQLARTPGLRDYGFRYDVPLNASDTRLEFRYRYTRSQVEEAPFDDLDIEGRTATYGIALLHPLQRSPGREISVGLAAELRRSQTQLLDQGFSSPGAENGRTKLAVLRFLQQGRWSGRSQVLALRSTLNLGLDVFGATEHANLPDSRFVSWLGQAQWVRRLPDTFLGSRVVGRVAVQLSNDPLLSAEQFALGGRYSVRGYRENRLVRDNGVNASLELRVPILKTPLGEDRLSVAPFVDFASGWNENERSEGRRGESLSSAGLGLLYRVDDRLDAAVYWGSRFKRGDEQGDDLQRNGIHFEVRARVW